MKGLHKFLDEKIAPPFKEGGRLHKFWPVYDSLETFAFVPGHTTSKGSHIRDGIDLKRTMFFVILAMVPCLLFGIWNIGHQYALVAPAESVAHSWGFLSKFMHGAPRVLAMIIVSYGAGLGVEFIFCILKNHAINEGFLVSGMLIPLIMPIDTPLWMVAVGTIFAVVIGKEVFGGTGMNILNVALTARAFLFFAYPTKMSGTNVWFLTGADGTNAAKSSNLVIDTFTGETPLGLLYSKKGAGEALDTVLANAGGGYSCDFLSSFIGTIPGSIGSTSVIAILIGAAFLIWTGIGSARIMISAVIGGALMGLFFNWIGPAYFEDNIYLQVPWYHQLALGGFMFGVVFMATDPVTAAQTKIGKVWYGLLIGILAILIRTVNPAYPEGIMLAILLMNVMAPTIDHYVLERNIKKRLSRVTPAVA